MKHTSVCMHTNTYTNTNRRILVPTVNEKVCFRKAAKKSSSSTVLKTRQVVITIKGKYRGWNLQP